MAARPPAERLLAQVARLIAREDDLDQLDRIAAATINLLAICQTHRQALRTTAPPSAPTGPIEWLDAKGLAMLLHRSESTVRHLPPDAIPGRRQQAKGYKVEWNKQVVLTWLAECSRQ